MPALFSLTLFVSAFLLFCIEPMVAKMLLPRLGGVPAVWNTCLVFFQGALLLGYVFSLGTLRLLGAKRQAVLQIVVVAGTLFAMPILIDDQLATRCASLGPVGQVLAILTVAAGLPFFALSTIAPTLQRWYSTTGAKGAADPYFLYAASNVGSLGALALYPLVFEPSFGLDQQTQMLRIGYVVLALLVVGCGVATLRLAESKEPVAPAAKIPTKQRARWVFLSAVPSAYLVAVTAHITTDVTPTPFLWVAPLAVYLLSFILVFAAKQLIPHARVNRFLPLLATGTAYALATSATDPIYAVIPLHVVGFFGACMLCHGELARERPEPGRLNEFYVWMSVGGFIGGLTVALVLPVLFTRAIEYPACLVLSLLARTPTEKKREDSAAARRRDVIFPVAVLLGTLALAFVARRMPPGMRGMIAVLPIVPLLVIYRSLDRPLRFAAAIGALLVGATFFPNPFGEVLERDRNFFGSLTVTHDPKGKWTQINHGTTIHGIQSIDPAGKREPRSYYTRKGPVGDVFRAYDDEPELPRRVAVIGLGAGTIAAYAKPGEEWTFFEINPAVVRIARDPALFTYLSDAFPGPGLRIVVGDARLEIAHEVGNYGALLIDAFSSDAIPVHLVTEEAMALYATKMAEGGVIAWHISNRSVDLRPVLAALAASQGFTARVRSDFVVSAEDSAAGRSATIWVAMSKNAALLGALGSAWEPLVPHPGFRSWTDQRSSIVSVLHF
ncbi:fused MFS/spermidine synthase [soil metagenome]